MVEIRRFGVMSVAKISGAIGLIMGLIMGIFAALMMLVGFSAGPAAGGLGMGSGGIFAAIIAFIVVLVTYAVVTFLWGAVAAFVYNLAAGWFGGIEFEAEGRSGEKL